ncbi:ADP-ribosylglycohydrolase family protein [Pseudoalteromonas luteoviolacea]|uniref:ADP-ribosylglycohydrolase family protein n=1 Tax=Pseudoalteromonas luteoviolacea TaxID=43657 RepID=UPI001B39DDBA|nr:ADP-ribosylglycohydrolase family protein [Pseudoalteromonas luteoviolacea]MBQ4876623.1 ADP-ribosylglycohydrolase family protein [Pseudoalteromonas luteoviolacea]MBQ4905254.1 ADP-ribosylglycohydrolase family protein [Pseudoalteromonas luteoviolacea]
MIEKSQFVGCFKGLAIGDALAASYEGGPIERLLWRFLGRTKTGQRRYTDDTQMSIDIAQSFLTCKHLDQTHLAQTFANSYRWSRGYGPSAANLLKGIKNGGSWEQLNRKKFAEGSMGNGAAMRAPIAALCSLSCHDGLRDYVSKSAEITHAHPQAIEGAQLIAHATRLALLGVESIGILQALCVNVVAPVYKFKLSKCLGYVAGGKLQPIPVIKAELGNGMLASESCVTALYFAFMYRRLAFSEMLQAICDLGGDADTIAAMAGAIWGASNGGLSLIEYDNRIEDLATIEQLASSIYFRYQEMGQ